MYSEDENGVVVLGGFQMGFLLSGLTLYLLQQQILSYSPVVRINKEVTNLKAPFVLLTESSLKQTVTHVGLLESSDLSVKLLYGS